MKGFMVFVVLVLGYAMSNIAHNGASAASYQHGFNAYLNHGNVARGPAIIPNK